MAPDLNSLALNGRCGYSKPGSSSYDIPNIIYNVTIHTYHHISWNATEVSLRIRLSRPLRVIIIGADFSSILMAYQIQKYCQNVEHVIYEKNADIGSTWPENRYPGCACEIPSHAYTYNFALNPDWPRFFSHAPDTHVPE